MNGEMFPNLLTPPLFMPNTLEEKPTRKKIEALLLKKGV